MWFVAPESITRLSKNVSTEEQTGLTNLKLERQWELPAKGVSDGLESPSNFKYFITCWSWCSVRSIGEKEQLVAGKAVALTIEGNCVHVGVWAIENEVVEVGLWSLCQGGYPFSRKQISLTWLVPL